MGHIGLTPQRTPQLGGFKVQGKGKERAKKPLEGAECLEERGFFTLILGCAPYQLAKMIIGEGGCPVIGIGAGTYRDGRVLVFLRCNEAIVRLLARVRREKHPLDAPGRAPRQPLPASG